MRLTNQTKWRTDEIRALICRVAKDELLPGQLKTARVTVTYRNGRYRLGQCTLGASEMRPYINMHLFLERREVPNPVQLAKVIAHEFAHAKGITHRDMDSNAALSRKYRWEEGWKDIYAYGAEFPISEKPAKVNVKPTAAGKLAKAQAMATKYQRKLKLTQTVLKRWQRRVKIYERLAATADLPPESPKKEPAEAL